MPLRRSVQAVAQALSERRLADAVWYDNTARQRKRGVGEHAGSGCRGLLALRGGGRPGLAARTCERVFSIFQPFRWHAAGTKEICRHVLRRALRARALRCAALLCAPGAQVNAPDGRGHAETQILI